MTSPPPSLLTIPAELRTSIFNLVLLDTKEICAPDPPYRHYLDLSLLSTNRQIYYETRAIPFRLFYFGNQYDPNVNFLSSLRLCPFQIAALKTIGIEYLSPGDLAHFLALGKDNGHLFGDKALDLDLLVIHADDWIGNGARRWRVAASPEDVQYGLPKSSRWLRALCGLKGWKQLEISFGTLELINEYWARGAFMQTLLDEFRSGLGDHGGDFTVWHASHDQPSEKIIVFRTKGLGRYHKPEWWKADVGRLVEGSECVLSESVDTKENDEGRPEPAFHVHERCGGPGKREKYCTRCQPDVNGV